MPIYQELTNLEEAIQKLNEPPILINNLANVTEDDREEIRNLIMTRYSGDMISLLPSCRCGATRNEASIRQRCLECGTLVESSLENDIQSALWFQKPYGVAKLINPSIWIMLEKRLKKSGFSVLRWLTDRSYSPGTRVPDIVRKLEQENIPRGYNNFVENFDQIINYLFDLKVFQIKGEPDYLRELLNTKRDCVFTDYIPVPNKLLFIVEQTNVGVYLDDVTRDAFDLILMMVSIDKNFHDQQSWVKENRTAKALARLGEFYEDYYRQNLSPKNGQFRRHVYGSRLIFSFRAVISSITDPHDHEGVLVPWGVGVTAFRPHLINKLMKYGFDLNSSVGLLQSHVGKYHPLLDRLLQELIDEAPDKKIWMLIQRNQPWVASTRDGSVKFSLIAGTSYRASITKRI